MKIREMTMKRFQLIKMMIWPDITSNENSVIIIIEIIIFWKHFTDTCQSKTFSNAPTQLFVPSRPNCERRCSIRHSSIEGNQLGKCFTKHRDVSGPLETLSWCHSSDCLQTLVRVTTRDGPLVSNSKQTLLDYWFTITLTQYYFPLKQTPHHRFYSRACAWVEGVSSSHQDHWSRVFRIIVCVQLGLGIKTSVRGERTAAMAMLL